MEYWFNIVLLTIVLASLTFWVYLRIQLDVHGAHGGDRRPHRDNPSNTRSSDQQWSEVYRPYRRYGSEPLLDVVFGNRLPRNHPIVQRYRKTGNFN